MCRSRSGDFVDPVLILFIISKVSGTFLTLTSLILVGCLSVDRFTRFDIMFATDVVACRVVNNVIRELCVSSRRGCRGRKIIDDFFLVLIFNLTVSMCVCFRTSVDTTVLALVLACLYAGCRVRQVGGRGRRHFFVCSFISVLEGTA